MSFSKDIKMILREKGFSNAKGARLCDIKPQQFNKYVTGHNTPSYDKAQKIFNNLGWSLTIHLTPNLYD